MRSAPRATQLLNRNGVPKRTQSGDLPCNPPLSHRAHHENQNTAKQDGPEQSLNPRSPRRPALHTLGTRPAPPPRPDWVPGWPPGSVPSPQPVWASKARSTVDVTALQRNTAATALAHTLGILGV